jgi:hypothetical protein
MARISKAIAAGLSAALAAFGASFVKDGQPATSAGWVAVAAGALAVGIIAGFATYSAPANQATP